MDAMNPITGNPFVGLNSNPMTILDPTGRYGEGGHYYSTYIVARETGLNHQDALTLALYSQLPDEIGKFDAIHQPVEGTMLRLGALGQRLPQAFSVVQLPTPPEPAQRFYNTSRVQTEFHAITGGLSVPETLFSAQTVINAPDLATAGLAIHRLGDTFAHRVMGDESHLYAPGAGHLGDGHDPDMISTRPKLYGDYVETLARTLAARQGKVLSAEAVANIRAKLDAIVDVPFSNRDAKMREANAIMWKGFQNNSDSEFDRGGALLARAAISAQVLDDQITAALRAKAMSYPEVVSESNTEPGSMLLRPEAADGSYFDAQGEEFENAMNFLDKSNPMVGTDKGYKPAETRHADTLLKNLESSALKLLDTQRRCRQRACR